MISITDLYDKVVMLIKEGVVKFTTNDDELFPKTYILENGRVRKAYRAGFYGVDSNAPSGSYAILLNMLGNESNMVALPQDISGRKKNLAEGEVVVHNTVANSWVYFKSDGSIEVECPNNLTVDVGGNATVNVSGDASITAANIDATASSAATVTAPTITLNGNVAINGTLSTTGLATMPNASVNGVSMKDHVHVINTGSSAPGPTAGPQ